MQYQRMQAIEHCKDQFLHSGGTISHRFRAMHNALTQLTCYYIQLPSLQQHRVLRQLKFVPYFHVFFICINGNINFIMVLILIIDGY